MGKAMKGVAQVATLGLAGKMLYDKGKKRDSSVAVTAPQNEGINEATTPVNEDELLKKRKSLSRSNNYQILKPVNNQTFGGTNNG
jgi:hypothetical protein